MENLVVKMIPLSSIDLSSINRKVDINSNSFKEFVDNIRQMGVLTPVALRKRDDGMYQIIFGGHRITACKILTDEGSLNHNMVPARIFNIPTEDTGFMQIVENLRTNKCTDRQYAEQLVRIMSMPKFMGFSRAEIAEKLGLKKSVSWLNNVLSLNDLIKEAADLLDAGKIPLSNAYVLGQLDGELQIDWLDKAQSMNSPDFTREIYNYKALLRRQKKGEDVIHDPMRDAKRRSITDLKSKYASLESMIAGKTYPPDKEQYWTGYFQGILFAMSLDADTLAEKEAIKAKEKEEKDMLAKRRNELLAQARNQAKIEAENLIKK